MYLDLQMAVAVFVLVCALLVLDYAVSFLAISMGIATSHIDVEKGKEKL
jgi:hypothetical protein